MTQDVRRQLLADYRKWKYHPLESRAVMDNVAQGLEDAIAEIDRLTAFARDLGERVAAQSELLSKRACGSQEQEV